VDYLQLSRDIAKLGQAAGVEAEAYIKVGVECEIKVSRGNVQQLSQAGSKGLGVRVIDDGRVGYAYTSDFDDVDSAWQAALELSRVSDPDPDRTLPEPQPIPDEDLEIYDPAVESTPVEHKVELAKAIEQAALEYDERIAATDWCTYFDEITRVYLANSRGFAGQYARSVVAGYLLAVGRDPDGQTTGLGYGVSPFLAEIDPAEIGAEAAQKAVRLLGGRPVDTQQVTVVFDPTTAAELVGWLAQALTAEAMQRERSFLLGKMGQAVASDRVGLLDNGRLARGFASAPFDGEGVPTSATKLIDEGLLLAVLQDSYTARKEGVGSTGNAGRGSHRSLPRLSPSNFYLQPGPDSPESIIAGVERGLYVISTMNVGGINPVNGDFSVGASGLWIERGQLGIPVTGVTVSSTLPEMLENITAVGNDLRFSPMMGAIGAPTIRVEAMMVAGRS
jgi:PmbA protein